MSTQRLSPSSDLYLQSPGNRLVAALNRDQRVYLLSQCAYVELPCQRVLYQPCEPITKAWFPVAGVASITTMMQDGTTLELAAVGREGMVGIPALLGWNAVPFRCSVRFSGAAWEIPAAALAQMFQMGGALQMILRRYLQARSLEVCQSAACNLLHSVRQRLAMWLLKTYDQAGSTHLSITHELLSEALGAQRSTITQAARSLELAELISYKHGKLIISDLAGLQQATCECYALLRGQMDAVVEPHTP